MRTLLIADIAEIVFLLALEAGAVAAFVGVAGVVAALASGVL